MDQGKRAVFYFRKDAAGTAHLVIEQNYWSKPMILKVVDGPPLPVPPSRPPPPPPKATAPTEKVVLRGIHFDFNKSVIRPGDAAVLDEDVARLKASPNLAIYVNGYCDAIGSEEYNLKLSDRRANAVVKYMVRAGVSESQLIPHGNGKTNFVSTNDTAEGALRTVASNWYPTIEPARRKPAPVTQSRGRPELYSSAIRRARSASSMK